MRVAFRNNQDHIALIGRYRIAWRCCMKATSYGTPTADKGFSAD